VPLLDQATARPEGDRMHGAARLVDEIRLEQRGDDAGAAGHGDHPARLHPEARASSTGCRLVNRAPDHAVLEGQTHQVSARAIAQQARDYFRASAPVAPEGAA
jgi:hypothetical protein